MPNHVIHIQLGTEYIKFGEIPVLTSEAIYPYLPNEHETEEMTMRDLYRAAARIEHESALERAEQDGLVRPRNPVSFVPDGFSIGDHGKKRLVHVGQFQKFAEYLGIEVVVDEPVACEPEDNEPMLKRHILDELRNQWPSIESDFREASRKDEDGKGNGLEKCKVPGERGMYYKKLVVEWAIKNRKMRRVSMPPTSTASSPFTVTRHKMPG